MVNRLCFILLGIMAICLLAGCAPTKPPILRTIDFAADDFDPITQCKRYEIYAFKISNWVTIGNEPRLEITVPDTLDISWNQPKRYTEFRLQPVPRFYPHSDSAFAYINNDRSIYRWASGQIDSAFYSVWVDFKLEGLYEGNWEISVRTVDLYNKTSQFSSPFQIVIRRVIVPAMPVDLRLWIKK